MTDTLFYLLALPLVVAIGFAAHRASLCTVKAVAEVITSGTGHMLASFGKEVLWAMLVFGSFVLLDGEGARLVQRVPFGYAVAGGFLFGVGAAANGGCSLSTLQRLADGDLTMLATLSGMLGGVFAWTWVDVRFAVSPLHTVPSNWGSPGALAGPLAGMLLLWALWESVRLFRSRDRSLGLRGRLVAETYRLSVAAAVLGIGAGLLYRLQGSWTYTGLLRMQSGAWLLAGDTPSASLVLLSVALLAGMVMSSWQRAAFVLRWDGLRAGSRHCLAGVTMGVGGALIPGCNDTLILFALPALSVQAMASYLALLAGIALTLLAMRATRGSLPAVSCASDRCGLLPAAKPRSPEES